MPIMMSDLDHALADGELDALLGQLRARPEELRWLAIAWETDLWAARRRAAAEGKPIFLWGMNGNPLGCT